MIFLQKTTSQEKPESEVKLLPILKSKQLLGNLENQPWFCKIKSYLNIPDHYFEALYVQLIEKFSVFVQVLPATTQGKLGSLLSESLARAILALKHLFESETKPENHRYIYAVFSAALLLNIGSITNCKIIITNEEGGYLADWLPYDGSLLEKGDYYKIYRYERVPVHLHRYAANLLARQAMPEIGFLWLTEDPHIFHMWLALLNGNRADTGILELILSITPEEIETFLEQGELSLPNENMERTQPIALQDAENFLHWLRAELAKGSISVNTSDAKLVVLPEGLFISMDLFKEFCSAYSSQYYTVVVKAFNHLGLTELSGSDLKFLQYFELKQPDKKEKNDFKPETGKASFGFHNQKTESSLKEQGVEKIEGVLIKEDSLLLKEALPCASFAKISPTPIRNEFPKWDSSLEIQVARKLLRYH